MLRLIECSFSYDCCRIIAFKALINIFVLLITLKFFYYENIGILLKKNWDKNGDFPLMNECTVTFITKRNTNQFTVMNE